MLVHPKQSFLIILTPVEQVLRISSSLYRFHPFYSCHICVALYVNTRQLNTLLLWEQQPKTILLEPLQFVSFPPFSTASKCLCFHKTRRIQPPSKHPSAQPSLLMRISHSMCYMINVPHCYSCLQMRSKRRDIYSKLHLLGKDNKRFRVFCGCGEMEYYFPPRD